MSRNNFEILTRKIRYKFVIGGNFPLFCSGTITFICEKFDIFLIYSMKFGL